MLEKIRKNISLVFHMNSFVLNKPIMQISVFHTCTSMEEDMTSKPALTTQQYQDSNIKHFFKCQTCM